MLKSNVTHFMLALLLIFSIFADQGVVCAEEKEELSELNKFNKIATVELDKQQLVIDVKPGTADYPDSTNGIKFDLFIGGCKLEVNAFSLSGQDAVQFGIGANGGTKKQFANVSNFEATSNGVKVTDDRGADTIDCQVVFKPHPDDGSRYVIDVKLDGKIPSELKLTSSAKMYKVPEKDDGKDYTVWIIVGSVSGGFFLLILIIAVIVTVVCIRRSKSKKQSIVVETQPAPVQIATPMTAEKKSKTVSNEGSEKSVTKKHKSSGEKQKKVVKDDGEKSKMVTKSAPVASAPPSKLQNAPLKTADFPKKTRANTNATQRTDEKSFEREGGVEVTGDPAKSLIANFY